MCLQIDNRGKVERKTTNRTLVVILKLRVLRGAEEVLCPQVSVLLIFIFVWCA